MREAHEVSAALESRRHDQYYLDAYGSRAAAYNDVHADMREIIRIYENDFSVVWPDGVVTQGLPKIANTLQLAADDRARQVAAYMPSLRVRAEKAGDAARNKSEKQERILQGYWDRNHVKAMLPEMAYQSMLGLLAVKVLPDFNAPVAERYPCFSVMEAIRSYPDPIFARGPYVDSFIYASEENVRNVEERYNVRLAWKDDISSQQKCRVIEYYDTTEITVVAEKLYSSGFSGQNRKREIVLQEAHGLSRCPVVIAPRPTLSNMYMSEFLGGLGVTNALNRLMTMILDDAFQKTYSVPMAYDIENPEEGGPGGLLIKQSKDASYEYVQHPNQPFTNIQLVRDMLGAVRSANMLSPSRSGDPNESIVSAAGINATQSQSVEDVRAIQEHGVGRVMEAANSLAFEADEKWCQPYARGKPVAKPVGAFMSQAETYMPIKDIAGAWDNRILYGMGAGLDVINQNVMVLQQLGGGLISLETAMELSPFVEDPSREQKRKLKETLQSAMQAGVIFAAQNGTINAQQLAQLDKVLDDDRSTLSDAIAAVTVQAPLAQPQPTAPGATAEAPGVAGAAEGQSLPQNLPPLAELLG